MSEEGRWRLVVRDKGEKQQTNQTSTLSQISADCGSRIEKWDRLSSRPLRNKRKNVKDLTSALRNCKFGRSHMCEINKTLYIHELDRKYYDSWESIEKKEKKWQNFKTKKKKKRKRQMFCGVCRWSSEAFHSVAVFGSSLFSSFFQRSPGTNISLDLPILSQFPRTVVFYFILFHTHQRYDWTLLKWRKCYVNLISFISSFFLVLIFYTNFEYRSHTMLQWFQAYNIVTRQVYTLCSPQA